MKRMKSVKKFVRKTLVGNIYKDLRAFKIFNEADLQCRVAQHLDKEFGNKLYLRNQPAICVGRGGGTNNVKPDIVLVSPRRGIVAAFELACFLSPNKDPLAQASIAKILNDVKKLGRLKQRHDHARWAFALIVVNVPDQEKFEALKQELRRELRPNGSQPEWTKRFFFSDIVNVFCTNAGRKRRGYDAWLEKWRGRQALFGEL